MNGVEIRLLAMGLFDHLPPNKKDTLATLDEARRLAEYAFEDQADLAGRRPFGDDGKSSSSKAIS